MMTAEQVAAYIVAQGAAPLAAAGWAQSGSKGAASEAGGSTEVLFDLASVTKPMTAVAIAWAGIDRTAPLGSLVEEARGTPSEAVPLELFLAHRAGLDAHRALYA